MIYNIKEFLNQKNIYNKNILHKLALAPMLEVTDTHFRTFIRWLTYNTTNWTEMIHCNTIKYNKNYDKYLKINPVEKPVILQLGGSDPENLKEACFIAKEFGYDEINLNVGCPSERVQKGSFGACLMKDPAIVRDCVKEMEKCGLEISVKCRLGVDHFDSYEFVKNFVKVISEGTNCTHFIIHARKAFLKGLNPKENRNIPPLEYFKVFNLIKDFPHLRFSINGGIKTIDQCKSLFKENQNLYGVMLGRAIQNSTNILYNIDEEIFDCEKKFSKIYYYNLNVKRTKRQVIKLWAQYCEEKSKEYRISYTNLIRPIISFFNNEKGAAKWRSYVGNSKNFIKNDSDYIKTFNYYLDLMEEFSDNLDEPITCNNIDNSINL